MTKTQNRVAPAGRFLYPKIELFPLPFLAQLSTFVGSLSAEVLGPLVTGLFLNFQVPRYVDLFMSLMKHYCLQHVPPYLLHAGADLMA